MRRASLAVASAILLACAAASGGVQSEADDGWQRVLPGLALEFPRDHGAHPAHRIEWWYLTGNVESEDGRRFGYQFTVFRRGMALEAAGGDASPLRARQIYAGHLALTDASAGRTVFAERLRRAGTPLAQASQGDLDVVLEDWSLRRGAGDRLQLAAGDAALRIALELELVPAKPLVLHGQRGYSAKGSDPGNASAYTSWTRLATNGTLQLGDEELLVRGETWFDHEYGTSVLSDGVEGWDWFGLQLEDGRELMAFVLRRADGSRDPASAGTLVARDGSTRALGPDDFALEPLARWTSERSGAGYPARWRLAIPSEGIELEITPLVADCELGTRSTGVAYWEGPVDVTGSVGGRGYAELTGYADSMAGRF